MLTEKQKKLGWTEFEKKRILTLYFRHVLLKRTPAEIMKLGKEFIKKDNNYLEVNYIKGRLKNNENK